ncbi:MAG: transcriptional regulator, partial [Prevotella sp.]|nr:transcriptional regulator [Prevotella sp.]
MERILITLIISALSCLRAEAQKIDLDSAFTELDRAIKLSPEYVAKKQEGIDHLKEKLAAANELRTRFRISHELYEEYLAFSNDSALSYISRCADLARQAGSTALVGECLSEMAFQ